MGSAILLASFFSILLNKVIQNGSNKKDLQYFHFSLQINIYGFHISECAWAIFQRLNQFMETTSGALSLFCLLALFSKRYALLSS
jgi:hypothetical protein